MENVLLKEKDIISFNIEEVVDDYLKYKSEGGEEIELLLSSKQSLDPESPHTFRYKDYLLEECYLKPISEPVKVKKVGMVINYKIVNCYVIKDI